MTNTAKNDSPEDHGVASKARVGKVSNDQRETVRNQTEGLASSICDLFAEAQCTLGSLAAGGHSTPAVSALGQGTVDVVRPDLGTALISRQLLLEYDFGRGHTIIRSSLTELNSAQKISDGRELSRNTSQGLQFLRRGLAFVLCVQDSYIVMRLVRTVLSGRDVVGQAIASLLVKGGS